jgi:hypothetical protein
VIILGKFASTERISSIPNAEQNLVATNVDVTAKWNSCDTIADNSAKTDGDSEQKISFYDMMLKFWRRDNVYR